MGSKGKIFNNFFGFTLIELLVSLVVISILMSLGYANFRKYSQKQALWAVARQIEGDLRLAQSYAMAGKDASICNNNLRGYQLTKIDSSSYQIKRVCSSGDSEVFKRNIPAGFQIYDGFSSVLFKSVSGGVETATSTSINIRRTGTSSPYIVVDISSTGLISLSYNE